jgi:hypothetical protein
MNILHGGTIASMGMSVAIEPPLLNGRFVISSSPITICTHKFLVDTGGSLAVASRGLFATGVSTDLNVTYLSSGGKIGDLIKAEVTCDKCTASPIFLSAAH